MPNHPATSDLNDFVDELLPPAERDAVARHVMECVVCGAHVTRLQALSRALARLPRDGALPPADDRMIRRDRPIAHRRWPVAIAAIAAAILVAFVGGVAVGRSTTPSPNPPRELRATTAGGAAQVTLAVQQTGTAYVEALARLNRLDGSNDERVRAMGREVALSTMLGATTEISLLAATDSASQHLLEAVRTLRARAVVSYFHPAP